MIRARRTGLPGFIAIAFGLHKMTPVELLTFANIARLGGYHGVANAAIAEWQARASS